MKGYKHSKKSLEKIRLSKVGKKRKPFSKEWLLKLSLSHKGKKQSEEWIKKRTKARKGYKMSEETKQKLRVKALGKKHSDETRRKIGLSNLGREGGMKGKYHSDEAKLKISIKSKLLVKRGRESNLWKGGLADENNLVRQSSEYKQWRKSVFKRDNFTCVLCKTRFIKGKTGKIKLNADHIKPFAYFPELRFELSNGRTLCVPCHRKTDTWGVRGRNYKITTLSK